MNLGRSRDIHYLHASECAFWDNFDVSMVSINQAIKPIPGTGIFLESTANGMNEPFYWEWMAAINGETNFEPIFIPWFWKETNRMPVPPDFELTKEEEELVFAPQCEKCKLKSACPRIWKTYANLAGFDEFKPIEKSDR